MREVEVRKLEPDDDRAAFTCGQPELDRFFCLYAGQNQFRHHIGTTYVAVEAGKILGFATVAPSQIDAQDAPQRLLRRLPNYPLPVLRLARLAVSEEARGGGVGRLLLRHTFALARRMAADFGCVGVVVDAKAEAVPFYERYGFRAIVDAVAGELGERPLRSLLFLPLSLIS